MESGTGIDPVARAAIPLRRGGRGEDDPDGPPEDFEDGFARLFSTHHERIYRMLARLSADRALAADLTQETFVRLYRRGEPPDRPEAWLITVSLNLFRNARTKRARRGALLTPARVERSLGDAPPSPEAGVEASEATARVRETLDGLPERERTMLLLHVEGYGYRDIAAALGMKETSVGATLARARAAFRRSYQEGLDAPR